MRDLIRGSLRRSLSAVNDEDRLAAAWPIACGKVLAERGMVVGFANGILRIKVADGAWLCQMMSMQAQLTREIARIAGVKIVEIHFDVKG